MNDFFYRYYSDIYHKAICNHYGHNIHILQIAQNNTIINNSYKKLLLMVTESLL